MAAATLDQFRNAILAASNLNVPGAGASPNMGGQGTANADTAIRHLQALSRSSFQVPAAKLGGAGAAETGSDIYDQQKAQNQLDQQKAADEASKAQQAADDMKNPGKYYRVQNKTGGWDFYAPDGTKITANDFATVKGQHVTDILKGSQNTKDQEFMRDYQDVTKLGEIMQSGDKKALQKLYTQDPTLKDRIGHMTYKDIVKNFRSSYPEFFPQSSTTDVGGASYGGSRPSSLAGGNSFLQKLFSFFGS